VWSEDGGWNYLYPESAAEYGLCLWMPVLRGELDVEHLFPNDFPAIFTATVTDYRRTNDVQCSWWTDTQNIEIVSPTSMTTQVKCSLVPSWAEFELEVEASIYGQPLLSRLSATYGTNSVPQIRISIQGADHVWKNQPISDANKRIYSVLIDADAPTSGVFSIEFVAGRNHANVSYLCPTEFVVSQTHMLPYERPFAVVEGVCASEECGEESFRWTFETEDGEILSGMKRFTVCEVESVLVWSKVSSEVTEPVAFPGQMTSVFCITNSFEVDRHYPIFFCDVVDTNLNIAPYSVEYRVKTRPEALTIHNAQTQLQLIDGPNCGELRSAYGKIGYYDTPCSGGVYKVSAFYGDSPGTETILVLPPAGASVDDVVSNDIIRAEDFVNAIEGSVPAIKRQSPMFGLQWFNDDGMGDYLGRVDSLPKPTIWAYNQVNDETGMGAVATWVGLPVRIAKASNFLVGYASTRIGVWDISRWAAQFIGTSNDESASISWRLGVSVAEGTNYNSVVGIAATNMWKVADEKVKRLWPNYELTDNHTTGLNSVDYNFNFISPGFTERGR